MKILFICKERLVTYGHSYGLVNSALFVSNFLNSISIESKVCTVTDGNEIDKVVFTEKPTHVIIEAIWVTPQKIKELLAIPRYSEVKWIIRIHSKIPFIANEGIAFPWIKDYAALSLEYKNLYIAPNSEEFTNDLKKVMKGNFIFLSNIYQPVGIKVAKTCQKKNYLDIGCFGAIRPMKNHLIQAVAAIEFGNQINKKIKFHVNATRKEQNGDNVLKNLEGLFAATEGKHELVKHEWMTHDDFVSLVRTMDYGLQVSLTESFNIVTGDFVDNEIPIIVSKDVEWMPFISKVNPNYSTTILNRLLFFHYIDSFGITLLNKFFLTMHNEEAKSIWLRMLRTIY